MRGSTRTIRVLRVWNNDVLTNLEGALTVILEIVVNGGRSRIRPFSGGPLMPAFGNHHGGRPFLPVDAPLLEVISAPRSRN